MLSDDVVQADLRSRNRAVVASFFKKLEAFDIAGFVELFARDGRQLMPFSPEGFPRELHGRAAIHNQYRGMPDTFTTMMFADVVIQDMADPARFFATYRGELELRTGGQYRNTYAGFFIVEADRIAEYHEYFDPIVLQRAFGGALNDRFNVAD